MTKNPLKMETLMRYLDGLCSPSEEEAVLSMLKQDACARQLLSDLCEQAVSLADLERTRTFAQVHSPHLKASACEPAPPQNFPSRFYRGISIAIGVAASILILGLWQQGMFGKHRPEPILTIAGVNSACQILNRFGQLDTQLENGRSILPGETVESQCSDSFLRINIGTRSGMTMAGYAYLRQMEHEERSPLLNFPYGSLWAEIEPESQFKSIRIQTSSALFEFEDAQFDLQTKRGYTRLRMNEGEAHVMRLVDQSALIIGKGQMIEITSLADQPLQALDQPKPVQQWQFHQLKGPDILLGEMRASLLPRFSDIEAVPLPWKTKPNKYIMLYAAAFSVSRSSANPVLLEKGSRIRYRFSYNKDIPVRFGFSTQRMQGVFAGKYETEVHRDRMAVDGDAYQVDLNVDAFRPLQANQAVTAEGLEINDIYALTIQEDAGLRIHWIEILPPEQ